MISTTILAALLGQSNNISQNATIAMLPGVTVVRGGTALANDGRSITLVDGDLVSINSPKDEMLTMYAPDNSIVTFHNGAAFRVEDNVNGREEYVLTKGKFDVYSCPHGAEKGSQDISFRTCCIRIWYPEQAKDVWASITVVGHEKCIVTAKSGIVYTQKTRGRNAYGTVKTV